MRVINGETYYFDMVAMLPNPLPDKRTRFRKVVDWILRKEYKVEYGERIKGPSYLDHLEAGGTSASFLKDCVG